MPLPYCLGQSRIPVNRLSEKKSISLVFLSNSSKKNLIESVFEKTSRWCKNWKRIYTLKAKRGVKPDYQIPFTSLL